MKSQKMITIDTELIEKLQTVNASATINKLLSEYFNDENSNDEKILRQKYEEFKAEKVILLKKMRHISQKIGKIRQKVEENKQKNMDFKAKESRKIEVEAIKAKFDREEITEEEYWEFFD